MLFTIVNIHDYIPKEDEFTWDKAHDIIMNKLGPNYQTVDATYCSNIKYFKKAYVTPPTFISIDGKPEISSGQLFTIINTTLPKQEFPILQSIDPFYKGSLVVPICNEYYYSNKDTSEGKQEQERDRIARLVWDQEELERKIYESRHSRFY